MTSRRAAVAGSTVAAALCTLGVLLPLAAAYPQPACAIGDRTAVDLRSIDYGGEKPARPSATQRMLWEVRQRTSVDTRLEPSHVRLDDPHVFDSPLLYWSGDRAFSALSDAEVIGLKRFVEFGGFVLIDDAAPEQDGFDSGVRRELGRAFGDGALSRLPSTHTIFRSFYLLERPVGRIEGPDYLEVVMHGERAAVVYSRHDLGGAFDRDNLGNYLHAVTPGGEPQREMAMRLGVNILLYALCLDYKDDQVHAPFIMRRRAGQR